MVELNHRQRTIKVKIVYYGPAVGGKTTNLQVLHGNAALARRGEMVSVHSAQDRTILFDLLPLKAAGFRGFELRLELAAVPGQAMYAATRRLVLKGADSVVFVANSAADRWDENVQSFREMADNLIAHQLDPASLPLVVQYNKRDLPDVTPIDFMERALNARKVRSLPAVAVRGEGVLETFGAVLSATMEDLAVRYQVVDLGRGQPLQKWVKQALQDMFGSTTLGTTGEVDETERPAVVLPANVGGDAPADRRSVRIDLPEDALRMASKGPSARANETLVDSYADVTARLTSEMAEMRDQRERLRRWLEQLQALAAAAQDLMGGQPREPTLRLALEPLAEAAGSRYAALLLPVEGGAAKAIALRGLAEDPLLRLRSGQRVLDRLLQDTEPRLHHSADSLDLGEALQEAPPSFASVASVPFRTASGVHAIGLLYYTGDDVLPGPPEMQQLRSLSALLAPALELSVSQERARDGERTSDVALLGLAARQGLADVLAALLRLRDGVADLRRDPALTAGALSALARVTPSLAQALGAARALVTFGQGEPAPGDFAELADVLGELTGAVELLGDPGPAVIADPALLKLALGSLAEYLRGDDGGGVVQLSVYPGAGAVKLRFAPSGTTKGAPASPNVPDPRLLLARKIVQQQGGSLNQETEDGRTWTVVVLKPA
jgi:signal recognition particle receptor subunit beta